jgi:hypothetical protein
MQGAFPAPGNKQAHAASANYADLIEKMADTSCVGKAGNTKKPVSSEPAHSAGRLGVPTPATTAAKTASESPVSSNVAAVAAILRSRAAGVR